VSEWTTTTLEQAISIRDQRGNQLFGSVIAMSIYCNKQKGTWRSTLPDEGERKIKAGQDWQTNGSWGSCKN